VKRRSAKNKELQDNAYLLRVWKKFHHEELEEALAGPHGAMVERLMFILSTLSQDSAPLLLAYVPGVDWSSVSHDIRLTVLHEINNHITRMRERHGLPPIDDPLPGQPDNVFKIVRSILLFPFSPAHEHRLSPSEVATAERTDRDVTAAVEMKE
jgi:hypothetical protein